MADTIDVATSRLNPHDHKECVQIMAAAQVPLETISRVVFLPHRSHQHDRRKNPLMATIISRARGILHCSNEQDARQYLLMKQVPFELIQRALYDERHRSG